MPAAKTLPTELPGFVSTMCIKTIFYSLSCADEAFVFRRNVGQ